MVRKPPVPPPPPGAGRPPPPLPGQTAQPAPASAALKVYFEGERFNVDKDRFVIGRGKQTSDLTIKDPNVSRQHAVIEFSGGQYYMVDMGSTNGVEFNGQRVQRKVIQEGDLFRICDHELRASFK
jgi:pSer/pThr/pTyr-binding forkhead associated (FHA) protein